MEEVNDSDNENDDYGIDDGDDQNATDDSDLIGHSHTYWSSQCGGWCCGMFYKSHRFAKGCVF